MWFIYSCVLLDLLHWMGYDGKAASQSLLKTICASWIPKVRNSPVSWCHSWKYAHNQNLRGGSGLSGCQAGWRREWTKAYPVQGGSPEDRGGKETVHQARQACTEVAWNQAWLLYCTIGLHAPALVTIQSGCFDLANKISVGHSFFSFITEAKRWSWRHLLHSNWKQISFLVYI